MPLGSREGNTDYRHKSEWWWSKADQGHIHSNVLNYSNILFSKKDLFLSSLNERKGGGVRVEPNVLSGELSSKAGVSKLACRPNLAYGLFLVLPMSWEWFYIFKEEEEEGEEGRGGAEKEESNGGETAAYAIKTIYDPQSLECLISGPLQEMSVDPYSKALSNVFRCYHR